MLGLNLSAIVAGDLHKSTHRVAFTLLLIRNYMTDDGSGSPPLPSGSVQVQPVAARVSESASRGVFSTGVVLLTGGNEFIVDFVQNLGSPTSVVSRVIIPHGAMARIIDAIERNVEGYEDRFGPIRWHWRSRSSRGRIIQGILRIRHKIRNKSVPGNCSRRFDERATWHWSDCICRYYGISRAKCSGYL